MPKQDRYSPRAKVKAGTVMYITDDILISPRYKPVVRVEKGTEVLIIEAIRGETFATVRTLKTPHSVMGTVEFIHLTPNR